MMRRTRLAVVALISAAAFHVPEAHAYPEFQVFSKKNSGRFVNCAMCHANADGPDGFKPGQIGRLKPEELARLNAARAAFKPGVEVDNPILNAFGNHIIKTVGKEKFLQLRRDPKALADVLGGDSDLDGDGVPDAGEYIEGTDPLDAQNGNPWKLLVTNLARNRVDVLLLVLATAAGMLAIRNLLKWFDREARAAIAAAGAKKASGSSERED
jgi:hypothetical protein